MHKGFVDVFVLHSVPFHKQSRRFCETLRNAYLIQKDFEVGKWFLIVYFTISVPSEMGQHLYGLMICFPF